MPGLPPHEQIAAEPGPAVEQARAVAEFGVELAPARAQRHAAEAAGRKPGRIIISRRQKHREAAMLDAQRLGEPQPEAVVAPEDSGFGDVERIGPGLELAGGEAGPSAPGGQPRAPAATEFVPSLEIEKQAGRAAAAERGAHAAAE